MFARNPFIYGVLITVWSSLDIGCSHPVAQDDSHAPLVIIPDPPPVPKTGCENPFTCTDHNGIGIYTAEEASAGIGTSNLLITYFMNDGSSVSFQGRYSNTRMFFRTVAGSRVPQLVKIWDNLPQSGRIVAADYEAFPHVRLEVIAVAEVRPAGQDRSEPQWTLRNPQTGKTISVMGNNIRRLRLHIEFRRIAGLFGEQTVIEHDTIDFAGEPIDHPDDHPPERFVACPAAKRRVSAYHMRWNPEGAPPGSSPNEYCRDVRMDPSDPCAPSSNVDSVVFQQGIKVDPVTGKVAHPEDDPTVTKMVTVSCYLGAPATVTRWGYDHSASNAFPGLPGQPGTPTHFYFDAAIQMKRASYCGGTDHHTKTGTRIKITDTAPGGNRDIQPLGPDKLEDVIEASWSPEGAICVNPAHLRRCDLAQQLLKDSLRCDNGRQLHKCTANDIHAPWIVNSPANQGSPDLCQHPK